MTYQLRQMLPAALAYAEQFHWPVFPLYHPLVDGCSCRARAECADNGKHPHWHEGDCAHGRNSATTDLAIINRWWARWPKANLGIPTGAVSGFVVLDIDPRHGGDANLSDLLDEYGPLPTTVESITGGGGRHILFRHPGGYVKSRCDEAALRPGVEIKGDGGYIVAPPSLHKSAELYTWEMSGRPGEVPIAPLPPWLLTLLRPTSTGSEGRTNTPGWIGAALDGMHDGNRNVTLHRCAGWLRRNGAGVADIIAILGPHADRVGLDAGELTRIAESAGRYPVQRRPKAFGARRRFHFALTPGSETIHQPARTQRVSPPARPTATRLRGAS